MSRETGRAETSSLISALLATGAWKLLLILFVYLSGILLLLPVLPTLVTNDFAARLNGGERLNCEQFSPGEEPEACRNAHAAVVWAATLAGFAQNTIFSVIFTPALGSWSDVNGRKPFLILAMLLASAPIFVVLLNMRIGLPLYYYYMVTAFSGSITCIAPSLSYLADVIPPHLRAASFGLVMASFSVAVLVGPVLGAALPISICPLVSMGVIYLCVVTVVFSLPESLPPEAAARAALLHEEIPPANSHHFASASNENSRLRERPQALVDASIRRRSLEQSETMVNIHVSDPNPGESEALLYRSQEPNEGKGGQSHSQLNPSEIGSLHERQSSFDFTPASQADHGINAARTKGLFSASCHRNLLSSTWRSLAILKRNPLFVRLTVILMLSAVVSEGLQDLLIQYLQLKLGFQPRDNGQLFVVLGAGSLIVQSLLLRPLLALLGEARLLLLGVVLSSIQQMILAIARNKTDALLAVGIGSFVTVTFPTISSIKANSAADHEQGTVQGALAGARSLASGMGPLAFAALFAAFTKTESSLTYFPGAPFVLGAVLMVATSFVTAQLPAEAGGNRGRCF